MNGRDTRPFLSRAPVVFQFNGRVTYFFKKKIEIKSEYWITRWIVTPQSPKNVFLFLIFKKYTVAQWCHLAAWNVNSAHFGARRVVRRWKWNCMARLQADDHENFVERTESSVTLPLRSFPFWLKVTILVACVKDASCPDDAMSWCKWTRCVSSCKLRAGWHERP